MTRRKSPRRYTIGGKRHYQVKGEMKFHGLTHWLSGEAVRGYSSAKVESARLKKLGSCGHMVRLPDGKYAVYGR